MVPLLLTSSAFAQREEDRWGIRLDTHTFAETLVPCQTLRLGISATITGAAFAGAFVLAPEMGRLGLIVNGPAGETRIWSRALGNPNVGPMDWVPPTQPSRYKQGYTEGLDLWLCYDLERSQFIFPTPGTYEIRAWLTVFRASPTNTYEAMDIESNPVTV